MKNRSQAILMVIPLILASCGGSPTDPDNMGDFPSLLVVRGSEDASQVCAINPDGTDLRIIAHYDYDGGYVWEGYIIARWSPDKRALAVAGGPGTTLENWPVWKMGLNGELTGQLTWNGFEPFWSKDGTSITYSRRRGYFSVVWDMFRLDVSTLAEDTVLYAETEIEGANSAFVYRLFDVFPNADHKLLLGEQCTFSDGSGRQTITNRKIIVYNIFERSKTYLTDDELTKGWARVSPDGTQIAFSGENPGTAQYTNNIYIMTSQGGNIYPVTTGSEMYYSHIMWSPDGNQLLYYCVDPSEGYHGYGSVCIHDIQDGSIDTLFTNGEEKQWAYLVTDWR